MWLFRDIVNITNKPSLESLDIHNVIHSALMLTCNGKISTVQGYFTINIKAIESEIKKLEQKDLPTTLKMSSCIPLSMAPYLALEQFLKQYHCECEPLRITVEHVDSPTLTPGCSKLS